MSLFLLFKVITTPSQMPVVAVGTPWSPIVPPGPLGPQPPTDGQRHISAS
jgi:hypothetical protein